MRIFENLKGSDIWEICGSFGMCDGVPDIEGDKAFLENEIYRVVSETKADVSGVSVLTGSFQNKSDAEIVLRTFSQKIVLDGGDYSVYTQSNVWGNESHGGWQELVTSVTAESRSIRSSYGAAPFAALWNEQSCRGMVFHIIPNGAWEIQIRRTPYYSSYCRIEITLGLNSKNLSLCVSPGETVELPEILFYPFRNKTDMDAFRLHRYINTRFPSAPMPVIYNTWLFRFDDPNMESVLPQVEKAAELGAEYFTVDAGWFGDGTNWSTSRGDWVENPCRALRGNMQKLADAVRAHGMKFGLWIEPEAAAPGSKIVAEHPDFFITYHDRFGDYYFLDFTNPDAYTYILNTVCDLIRKYGIEFVKFDYNQDMYVDITGDAFTAYQKGYNDFIKDIRAQFPSLYIEGCASGGMHMDISGCRLFDSYWLSDNADPYDGVRIVRETLLRLSPRYIERWAMLRSLADFSPVYLEPDKKVDKLFASADSQWDILTGTDPSYMEGFLAGGPIGLSCDLCALSDSHQAWLTKIIADFKENRAFWQNAICHLLTATKTMTVFEYADPDYKTVRIHVVYEDLQQHECTVYPVLDKNGTYTYEGTSYSGEALAEKGIHLITPLKRKGISLMLMKEN